MSRFILVFLLLVIVASLPQRLQALTEQEKKKLFLQAREEIQTLPEEPKAPPKAKPKPKPSPKKKPTPRPQNEEEQIKQEKTVPAPRAAPTPTPAEPVRSAPTPAPSATPQRASTPTASAPITVQKSGLEEESGYEPPPPPPTRRFWFFGGPAYRYLTRSVRSEIDRPKVKKHLWRYIVVHNSGTKQGNARVFDYYHLHTRKMPNGLAYHFVIGNGTSSGDGEVEVGGRWKNQINGGHVHSDYLNSISIGICLVGDYNRSHPTKAQMESLKELVEYLRKRVGKTDGKLAIVKPHRDINPRRWPTDCPGDKFPYSWLEREFD